MKNWHDSIEFVCVCCLQQQLVLHHPKKNIFQALQRSCHTDNSLTTSSMMWRLLSWATIFACCQLWKNDPTRVSFLCRFIALLNMIVGKTIVFLVECSQCNCSFEHLLSPEIVAARFIHAISKRFQLLRMLSMTCSSTKWRSASNCFCCALQLSKPNNFCEVQHCEPQKTAAAHSQQNVWQLSTSSNGISNSKVHMLAVGQNCHVLFVVIEKGKLHSLSFSENHFATTVILMPKTWVPSTIGA